MTPCAPAGPRRKKRCRGKALQAIQDYTSAVYEAARRRYGPRESGFGLRFTAPIGRRG